MDMATESTKTVPDVTIVGIYRADNGMFVVADASHRTHYASDTSGLGMLIEQLIRDPSLPRAKVETNDAVAVASGLARKLTQAFAPEFTGLVEAIEPGAHAIANTLERTRATRGSRRRKPKARVQRG